MQIWAAEPDERKYWKTLEQVKAEIPDEEARKRWFNFAYEVAEGVWSSECYTPACSRSQPLLA